MNKPNPPPLSGYWLELYEERAAIMEYDGKMSRTDAEAAAWAEIKRRMGEASRTLFEAKRTGG